MLWNEVTYRFYAVRSVILNGSETWEVTEEDWREMTIIVWWMGNVTLNDRKSSDELRDWVGKHMKVHTKW